MSRGRDTDKCQLQKSVGDVAMGLQEGIEMRDAKRLKMEGPCWLQELGAKFS